MCTKTSDSSASVSNIFCNASVQFTNEYVFFGYVLLSAILDPYGQKLHHGGVSLDSVGIRMAARLHIPGTRSLCCSLSLARMVLCSFCPPLFLE